MLTVLSTIVTVQSSPGQYFGLLQLVGKFEENLGSTIFYSWRPSGVSVTVQYSTVLNPAVLTHNMTSRHIF